MADRLIDRQAISVYTGPGITDEESDALLVDVEIALTSQLQTVAAAMGMLFPRLRFDVEPGS